MTTPHEDDHRPPEGDPRSEPAERTEPAVRIGGLLGRLARRARAVGEEAARSPEAERLARRARAAAEAARPHVERAGREAVRYVREHDDEIKRAARIGAEVTARRVIPTPLRPIVEAVEADRWRRAPLRDPRAEQFDRIVHEDAATPATEADEPATPGEPGASDGATRPSS